MAGFPGAEAVPSVNLSFETSKGKQERKRQDLYNGLLPFGTTKEPAGVPLLDTTARGCNLVTRAEIPPCGGRSSWPQGGRRIDRLPMPATPLVTVLRGTVGRIP